jgi:hypothetical protein
MTPTPSRTGSDFGGLLSAASSRRILSIALCVSTPRTKSIPVAHHRSASVAFSRWQTERILTAGPQHPQVNPR